MESLFRLLLSLICLSVLFSSAAYCADFNIKLRKTDINELKQQIIPTFDYNIQVLNQVLRCLERGNEMDVCLEHLSVAAKNHRPGQSPQKNVIAELTKRNEIREKQIKEDIKQKISQQDISKEEIITNLRKLLIEAKKVRFCLNKGQTANDLKDCVLQFKHSNQ